MGKRWIGAALSVLLAVAVGPVRAQVDVEQYIKREGYERIKISPDGLHYAATFPTEDRTGLVILRRSDKKVVATALGLKNSVVAGFWWANDERVVIAMGQKLGDRDQPYPTGELFALGIEGGKVKTLVQSLKDEVGMVAKAGDISSEVEYAEFLSTLPGDPRSILISVSKWSDISRTQVDRLDLYSGRRTKIATAPVRRADFVADVAGRVRFAMGAKDDNYSKLYYREDDDSDWRLINDEATSGRIEDPLGFAADGAIAYLQVTQSTGPDSIVAWNTRTGDRAEILRDPVADPYDILFSDLEEHVVLGALYMDGEVRSRFVDEKSPRARLWRSLEKAFAGSAITITSTTRDGKLALLQVWNDRTPGDYYLYDVEKKTANGVAALKHWLHPDALPASRGVQLQARDGVTLRGYLTSPRGDASNPRPMVVMPHGGPFGIFDTWGFDEDAIMLAEAGYAVLRVNYRGSGNYGDSFHKAGAREWGGRMQDDLTDATRWAVEQKIADPERICLYGASYGGYAALMGLAKEPDLYRCAAGYVGIYDLETRHRDLSRTPSGETWANDWMGPREELGAVSPTALASRIKAPVFLAAGGEDVIAPIAHSKKMERALRAAKVPVETLYIGSEGHGFYKPEHQKQFYTRLLDFLSRHLGGTTATTGAKVAR